MNTLENVDHFKRKIPLKISNIIPHYFYCKYKNIDFWIDRALSINGHAIPEIKLDNRLGFDQNYLSKVEKKLKNIDRFKCLNFIADGLKVSSTSEDDLFDKYTFFCQAISKNYEARQPVHDAKGNLIVSDPLILLELAEMRCGHIARFGVDLAEAIGWKGRLVQLAGHVVSEINVRDKWRLVDFDILGGGQQARGKNNEYLSLVELNKQPNQLDRLFTNGENSLYVGSDAKSYRGHFVYPSYYYFAKKAYKDTKPCYYTKNLNLEESSKDRYFGWHNYSQTPVDDFSFLELDLTYCPGPVDITEIKKVERGVRISWSSPPDSSKLLSHFKIFMSSVPREWNYMHYYGRPEYQKYCSEPNTLKKRTYKSFFEAPVCINTVKTNEMSYTLNNQELAESPFVSIMPVDTYGLSIGRERWSLSPEYNIGNVDN